MTKKAPQVGLWGGIECTHNRVGNEFYDQVRRTGHDRRPEDIERIAELGIQTVRYPALWEWAAPHDPTRFNWSWPDERLELLRKAKIRPIVGLVHHGSGPSYTDLMHEGFAEGLGRYALQFARRYPWIQDYTPVNEPLTTARFSCLYGLWYPHRKDDCAFAVAFFNQCRAIVLAMQAVRSVQSEARLIQTEDLGKTFSRRKLAYQARFENERRWLTYDLLCGRVDRHHPMGSYFLWLGLPEEKLHWFQENPCPPDVIGINHYVTSDRFLDDRIRLYPPHTWGGNKRHPYVDVEAVRVRAKGIYGIERHLRDAWRRYRLPLAISETHLGCTREEQVRWVWETWQAANQASARGIDVQAMTLWSIFGAYDWDSLVTQQTGTYEPGVFDVRSGTPRPTALASLARELATERTSRSPVLDQPGWWHRSVRLLPTAARRPFADDRSEAGKNRLLITGATGTLGRTFARTCECRGLEYSLLGRAEMDIADFNSVEAALNRMEPWGVINAAGYVRVDEAEADHERCWRENVQGPTVLATACQRAGIPLMTFSSDLVFDGQQRRPYRESDHVNPLNTYGRTKAEAERQVAAIHPQALLIRTSAFFDSEDEYNFPTLVLRELLSGRKFSAAVDATVSPTFLPDLANACLDLLLDKAFGIWHLSNQGEISWAHFARSAAETAGLNPDLIECRPMRTFCWSAPRPSYSALGSERGLLLPPLEDALARFSQSWKQKRGTKSAAPESVQKRGGARAALGT